ncbi:hypothetical protein ACW7G0_00850 [Lysobacter sp. A286]
MGILISGLDEAECRDFIGADAWTRHQARWCAPEALAPDTPDSPQIIWLYHAPWHVLDGRHTGSQATLVQWMESNRAVLNMRRQLADRLTLVNVERVPQTALRGRLAGKAPREPDTITGMDIGPASLSAQAPLLGLLFERAAPQYWDVLEALEASAWLPSGEPLVRGDAESDESALFALLDALHDATGTTEQQSELRKLQQEQQGLKQESELLLLQLHQVQEELEQYYLKNIDLDKSSVKDKKALVDMRQVLQEAQRNDKALQIQLRQMQDELKRHHVMRPPRRAAPASTGSSPVPPQAPGTSTKGLTRLLPGRIRNRLDRARTIKAQLGQMNDLRQSEWFDAQWYLEQYPDIRATKSDPVEHYFSHGWKENRNPGVGFDTAYYLRSNPDVSYSAINPLWHFIHYGRNEGRLPRKP